MDDERRVLFVSDRLPRALRAASAVADEAAIWRADQFELQEELYRGKNSSLHRARHLAVSGSTPIALKAYRKRRLTPITRFQVEREVRHHGQLVPPHPNIVALHAAFEDEDNVYLAMEFADGGDLFEAVKRAPGRRFDEARAVVSYLAPLLSAVSHLHAHGVLHRDIKPENVLLANRRIQGSSGAASVPIVKLADLGLSICVEHERPVTRAGTLDFMAPEILVCPDKRLPGDNKAAAAVTGYGAAVDTWALGVLAYELIVGRCPFEAETRPGTYEAIMYREASFPAHVSSEARDFIASALSKAPGSRPSVAELRRHPWILQHAPAEEEEPPDGWWEGASESEEQRAAEEDRCEVAAGVEESEAAERGKALGSTAVDLCPVPPGAAAAGIEEVGLAAAAMVVAETPQLEESAPPGKPSCEEQSAEAAGGKNVNDTATAGSTSELHIEIAGRQQCSSAGSPQAAGAGDSFTSNNSSSNRSRVWSSSTGSAGPSGALADATTPSRTSPATMAPAADRSSPLAKPPEPTVSPAPQPSSQQPPPPAGHSHGLHQQIYKDAGRRVTLGRGSLTWDDFIATAPLAEEALAAAVGRGCGAFGALIPGGGTPSAGASPAMSRSGSVTGVGGMRGGSGTGAGAVMGAATPPISRSRLGSSVNLAVLAGMQLSAAAVEGGDGGGSSAGTTAVPVPRLASPSLSGASSPRGGPLQRGAIGMPAKHASSVGAAASPNGVTLIPAAAAVTASAMLRSKSEAAELSAWLEDSIATLSSGGASDTGDDSEAGTPRPSGAGGSGGGGGFWGWAVGANNGGGAGSSRAAAVESATDAAVGGRSASFSTGGKQGPPGMAPPQLQTGVPAGGLLAWRQGEGSAASSAAPSPRRVGFRGEGAEGSGHGQHPGMLAARSKSCSAPSSGRLTPPH